MSNWITITKADIYNSKAATLVDQINQNLLGNGQTDRLTGIIADVTLEIRRRVAKCNQLDADATRIPGGLKPLAVDLIFCRLKIAVEMELNEDERRTLARRETELDRVAAGDDVVDPPDNPIAANFNQPQPKPSFGTSHREFTRWSQDG